MDDLIRRADAIKAIDDTWIKGTSLCQADEAIRRIDAIPSVEPFGKDINVRGKDEPQTERSE